MTIRTMIIMIMIITFYFSDISKSSIGRNFVGRIQQLVINTEHLIEESHLQQIQYHGNQSLYWMQYHGNQSLYRIQYHCNQSLYWIQYHGNQSLC